MPRSAYADRIAAYPSIAFSTEQASTLRGRWHNFFRDRIGPAFDGRIVFEIGCFDAKFLRSRAAEFPETAFIGLDWKYRAVHDGAAGIEAANLPNVVLIRGRGQDCARLFGDAELHEIWLLHPDPCARPEERCNRLFGEPFLLDARRTLKANGRLVLKTDHAGYFQWALAVMCLGVTFDGETDLTPVGQKRRRHRAKQLVPDSALPPASEAARRAFEVALRSDDFWADGAVLSQTAGRLFAGQVTPFERRFVDKGLPIYFLEIRAAASTSDMTGTG